MAATNLTRWAGAGAFNCVNTVANDVSDLANGNRWVSNGREQLVVFNTTVGDLVVTVTNPDPNCNDDTCTVPANGMAIMGPYDSSWRCGSYIDVNHAGALDADIEYLLIACDQTELPCPDGC